VHRILRAQRIRRRSHFVEEGESAKTAGTEFQKLISYCGGNRKRVQFIVVYSSSRFSRDQFVHVTFRALLKKQGVTLRSVTEPIDDTSTGRLMETMLSAIAQFENDVKADRTKAGMQAALESGRWTFGAPLGYVRTGGRGSSIVPDRERAPHIRRAFELLASGLHTKQEILRIVNTNGLRTLRGKPVSTQTFQALVRNPIFAGWMKVRGWQDLPPMRGDFEPIVTQEVFDQAQAVLDGKRSTVTSYSRNHPDFPLRRFAHCEACRTPLTASWSQGRSKRYAHYRCRSPKCRGVNVSRDTLHAAFVAYLEAMRPKPEFVRLFREIVLDVWRESQREIIVTRKRLQDRLDTLHGKKDRVVEAFLHERLIDQATYQRQVANLDEEIASAEVAVHEAHVDEIDVEGVLGFAEHLLSDPARMWSEATLDQRQRLQKVLFPQGVTCSPDGRFGTAETSVIFRLLQALPAQNEKEASPTGFEPVLPA
jgi:site-specific DNA recombinase